MATFISTAEIAVLRGPFVFEDGFDEEQAAQMLAEFASAEIRRNAPTIDADIIAGTVSADLAKWVAYRMVSDVLNNPERYTSEGILDATYRFDAQMVRNQMKMTDEELRKLQPVSSASPKGGTINVKPWCP